MSIFSKPKKEKKTAKEAAPALAQVSPVMHSQQLKGAFLVQRPYLSEKAHRLETHRGYVFLVDASANKEMVKRYVESHYKVNVERVNITNVPPKVKQFRGRVSHITGRKKAIVRVREGQHIEIS